jgi:hypothetical protein
MMHRLGLAATFVLSCSLTLFAQDHQGTNLQGHPHGPHDPVDPQLHAAMHSLLGTWTGTLSSAKGPELLRLVAANDPDGYLTLTFTSDSAHFGLARDVALKDKTLRWTQALADQSCGASASLVQAKEKSPETLKGSLSCGGTTVPFALEKTKE